MIIITIKVIGNKHYPAKIRQAGGKIQAAVTSKTDYVVCDENSGSKYEKAKKLGIPILPEAHFLKMLNKYKHKLTLPPTLLQIIP